MIKLLKANLSRSGEILPRPPRAVNNFFFDLYNSFTIIPDPAIVKIL